MIVVVVDDLLRRIALEKLTMVGMLACCCRLLFSIFRVVIFSCMTLGLKPPCGITCSHEWRYVILHPCVY